MCITYSIPNLQFDVFIVDLYGPCTKFDTYGQVMLLSEAFVCKLQEQA